MTQRQFDIENKKDMADLWDIIPESIIKIRKAYKSKDGYYCNYYDNMEGFYESDFLLINWHDKTEIFRPLQEATEQDVGKICKFWNDKSEEFFGRLGHIGDKYFTMIAPVYEDLQFLHCRRLTKQEIEELC